MAVGTQDSASSTSGVGPRVELSNLIANLRAANWRLTTSCDEPVYQKWMDANDVSHSYENSWAYIFQQSRLAAFRFVCNDMLLTAVLKDPNSPFIFLLPPIGQSSTLETLLPYAAQQLATVSQKRVVLRKIAPEDAHAFSSLGFRRIEPEQFALGVDFPEDAYPQVVLETNIGDRLPHESIFQKTRNQLTFLHRQHRVSFSGFSETPLSNLREVIGNWANAHNASIRGTQRETSGFVDPAAYLCLIDEFSSKVDGDRFFGQIISLDDEPAGLAFAGRTGATSAALYASLCIQGVRGASEAQLIQFLTLLGNAGILSVNLGGAETKGLFTYKQKYGPLCLKPKVDLEFDSFAHAVPSRRSGLIRNKP